MTNLSDFLSENHDSFCQTSIGKLLSTKIHDHIITEAELAERVGTSWVYLYQIFTGKRHPSRNMIISIGLAISCTLEELQSLLHDYGYAELNMKSRRDAIIIYGFHHKWDVNAINHVLHDEGERLLYKRQMEEEQRYSQFIQLGLNIANYRKLRNLTRRELAEKVGLPTIRIRNIEFPRKITTPVSLEEIFDIGEALEVKVMKFFDFRE